mmetsp:Transcript_46777/g.87125  ORF Transcript_46777/g.87125 Transcript_46777/m.87125 type:complete len:270 (-) Transcript_46777:611-1420(-)
MLPQLTRQLGCLAGIVVHALQESVLKRDAAFGCQKIAVAVIQKGVDRVHLCARDQLSAQLLVCGMQRDCERRLQLMLRKLHERVWHSDGGYGDVPSTNSQILVQRPVSCQNRRDVQHGLTHAHEYDMRDALLEVLLDTQHLVCDFVRLQITRKAALARGAECAAHGTPNLGGDANCEARVRRLGCRDAHRLDDAIICQLQEHLHRPILGLHDMVDLGSPHLHERLSHFLAERLWNLSHLLQVPHAVLVHGIKHLLPAVLRLTIHLCKRF